MVKQHISDFEAHRINYTFGTDPSTNKQIFTLDFASSIVDNTDYRLNFFFKGILDGIRHQDEINLLGSGNLIQNWINMENGYQAEDGLFISRRDGYPFTRTLIDGTISYDFTILLPHRHDLYVQLIPSNNDSSPITVYLDY